MPGSILRGHGFASVMIASLFSIASAAIASAAVAQNAPPAPSTIDGAQLHGIFGLHVTDLNGDDAGRLWDILIDHDGKPRAAVIDYGGVLGVGQRKVAVAWQDLHLVPDDAKAPIHLALTRQQLGAIPDFKYDATATTAGGAR
jgi:hypothetical protein